MPITINGIPTTLDKGKRRTSRSSSPRTGSEINMQSDSSVSFPSGVSVNTKNTHATNMSPPTISSELVMYKVVGVTKDNRQAILREMQQAQDSYFYLCKEPENTFDVYAIKVCNQFQQTVGYISKDQARELHSCMRFSTSTLSKAAFVGGGPGQHLGLRVWLQFRSQ